MATENAELIPDKLYFKIGEVCDIVGVKQHVLRYWETEFNVLRPHRAASQQRLYRRTDVENVLRIKRLLKEEGYTISGARKMLVKEKQERKNGGVSAQSGELLHTIKKELHAIKEILED